MKIEIIKMHIVNFKGVRDYEITFDGKNTTFAGANESGKTTLFDAFVWLLFGKDSRNQDQTKFDIKPIDPVTHEAIHHLQHYVEAVLSVDGSHQTLRRVWAETWTRKTGNAESKLSGHKTSFYINGVNVGTKKAFDDVVREWVNESVFRMITNPFFFIDDKFTDWTKRRETLLSLAGDIDRTEINTKFADLIAEMNGERLAAYRKRIATAKRESKADVAKCEPAINAYKRAMPEPVDVDALTKERAALNEAAQVEIADINRQIAEIDREIAAVRAGDDEVTAKIVEKRAKIGEKRSKIAEIRAKIGGICTNRDNIINARIANARRENNDRAAAIDNIARRIDKLNREIDNINQTRTQSLESINVYETTIESLKSELNIISQKYSEVRHAAFEYTPTTVCPMCKQQLPAASVEEAIEQAREMFVAEQRDKLQALIDSSNAKKAEIERQNTKIDAANVVIDECVKKAETLTKQRDELNIEKVKMEAVPENDLNAATEAAKQSTEYKSYLDDENVLNGQITAIEGEIADVETEISALRTADTSGAEHRRADLIAKIADVNARLAAAEKPIEDKLRVVSERERIQKLIDEETEREKVLNDEIARLERAEKSAMEYSKANVALVEDSINRLFRVARWKMFETTLDGEDRECCEVMNEKGVPYDSMNDGKRILVGLDVIRVFGDCYDVHAPIFIDNGESITSDIPDLGTQVIRLNADKRFPNLTVIE